MWLHLVDDLHNVESSLINRVEKAKRIRQQLFNINDSKSAAAQLQQLNVEAKVLANSLLKLNDIRFQIRSAYPYPLAYTYRTLDAIAEPAERYRAQLRVAENFLAFLGSVGLALAAHIKVLPSVNPSKPLSDYLKQLWDGGISPGSWQDLAQQTAKALSPHREYALISNYSSLWFKGQSAKSTAFSELLKKIPKIKNDFKHDRGLDSPEEYKIAGMELEVLLNQLYEEIKFFIQHPIRLVQRIDTDRYSGKVILDTLVLKADHPGLEQQRVMFDRPLPVGDLYIELEEGNWANLHPFVSMHICPKCQSRETYLIDAWKRGSFVRLKSFERGHVKEFKESANAEALASDMSSHLNHWLQENT